MRSISHSIVAIFIAGSVVGLFARAASPVAMHDLTVPADRLPAGCTLASPATANRVLSVFGPNFPTNPWEGTDRQHIVAIRGSVAPFGPAYPDGPPTDPRALSHYQSRYDDQLANGAEEAYRAVYTMSDATVVTVSAVRFAPGQQPTTDSSRGSRNPGFVRVEIGSIVAVVNGNDDCAQSVSAYLRSLASPR